MTILTKDQISLEMATESSWGATALVVRQRVCTMPTIVWPLETMCRVLSKVSTAIIIKEVMCWLDVLVSTMDMNGCFHLIKILFVLSIM